MKPRKRSYEMDMTNGPLLGKLVRFAIPLGLSGILQLLFNAADIVVVGRFAGSGALAAVGSTGALINLIVNLFIGLSVGTNVLAAQYYGAGNRKDLQETVHTSVLTSLIFGVVLLVIGISLADPLLALMGTPEEVLPQASLYMRIFFLGMPASMLYNFGAAILRAVGDTKRPLYFLLLSLSLIHIFSVMLKTGNEHFINDPLVDIQHDIKESKSIVQNSIPDSDFMKTLSVSNYVTEN